MSTDKSQHGDTAISVALPPWRETGWTGPLVEVRPENADPAEWPDGAVERVVFTLTAFPEYPYPQELPYAEFFGTDGWPLHTPQNVKPQLDIRMQAELRRWPWMTRPHEWNEGCWLVDVSDYNRFMRWAAQARRSMKITTAVPARAQD